MRGTLSRLLPAAVLMVGCGLATTEPISLPTGQARPAVGVQQRPTVRDIDVRQTSQGDVYYVTLHFSSPMEVTSLTDSVYVAPAVSDDGTAYSVGTLQPPDPEFGYYWDSTATTVTMQFSLPEVAIWRVLILAKARDQLGIELDGTAPMDQGTPDNLARSADDGFSAPASHVSLPYYRDKLGLRGDHPHFRLNQDLPRARLRLFAGAATSPWAELESDNDATSIAGRTVDRIEILLQNRNARHAGDDQAESLEGAYFHPASVSHVELRDAQDRRIAVGWSFDRTGLLMGQSFAVTSTVDGSQFVGLDGLAGVAWIADAELALVRTVEGRASLLEYVQAVTGGVLFPAYWVRGNAFGISTEFTVRDLRQAWRAGLFVQQQFDSPAVDSPIVTSAGNWLALADPIVGCEPSCAYAITYHPWLLLATGQSVQLVSSTLHARTQDISLADHPLPWRVLVRGGPAAARDWRGLPVYDGVRDGDETTGVADDTLTWTLLRP